MSTDELRAALAAAQAAYMQLMMGRRGVSFSYTQGDGARSVTYTATSTANLMALIGQLKEALGIVCQARRPARFFYR